MNKSINLETTMIYRKRKKNGKKGHRVFYLSKEQYQKRFYMELLLIVHQHWFIFNINISCTYEPLLIYKLQQLFHIEPLLIL
jgi:hypothetical protein